MRTLILVILCCTMGAAFNDGVVERIRARGRCRKVFSHRNEVVVRFTCQEDADLFARDLKTFLGD